MSKYFQHSLGVVGEISMQTHYRHKNKLEQLHSSAMVRKGIIH